MRQTAKQLAAISRQAITTKFLSPTDHHGSRISAKCEAKRMTVSWDHALSIAENHASAALILFQALKWDEHHRLVMGGSPGKDGFVFVQVPKAREGRYHVAPGRIITSGATEGLPSVATGRSPGDIILVRPWGIRPVTADALTHWIAAQMSSDSFDLDAVEADYIAAPDAKASR